MCFSAQASFLAAGLLTVIAIASYAKATRPSYLLLAVIPLFFALQQYAEGILWLSIPQGGPPWLLTGATYLFLTIAGFGWPFILSFTAFALEKDPERKRVLAVFVGTAVLWALVGGYHLFAYGITTAITESHILYTLNSPFLHAPWLGWYYCAAILLPFFIASRRSLNLLGIAITLSCAVAYIFWYNHFLSVWCFFAALISAASYFVLLSLKKEEITSENDRTESLEKQK
ncbi:hypothetical protein H0X06_03865 [Candidatus Dependentiae bacterium]|nr:hypothetical protein [Candidatus Dependentiae bacterium]